LVKICFYRNKILLIFKEKLVIPNNPLRISSFTNLSAPKQIPQNPILPFFIDPEKKLIKPVKDRRNKER